MALEHFFTRTSFPQEPAGDSTLGWNPAERRDSRHLGVPTWESLGLEVGFGGKSNMGKQRCGCLSNDEELLRFITIFSLNVGLKPRPAPLGS